VLKTEPIVVWFPYCQSNGYFQSNDRKISDVIILKMIQSIMFKRFFELCFDPTRFSNLVNGVTNVALLY